MNRGRRLAVLAGFAVAAGCAGDKAVTTGASATGAGATPEGPGGGLNVGSGGGGGEGFCDDVVLNATTRKRPADIIFVIDNSSTMRSESEAVEENINVNFASIIQSSDVDYRVIMITKHGPGTSPAFTEVCIDPPLSGTTDCHGPPVFVPGRFYHYDVTVKSHDSVCRALGSMFGHEPDAWNLGPDGWNAWLRPEALKLFVEITDDAMGCTHQGVWIVDDGEAIPGEPFDRELLNTNPAQFGSPSARNYVFHSITGLAGKPANPADAYTAAEPLVSETCTSGLTAGPGYQRLSILTGGLRFPVCHHRSYDAVFQDIAAGVVEQVDIPCTFELPEPPPGQGLDLDALGILFTPGGGGTQSWTQVDGAEACGPGHFYVDESTSPTTMHLCPEACAAVEGDGEATLEVEVECGFTVE